jgi:hypothetical protein
LSTVNGCHSHNVIENGFSKLNKLPLENKQTLREEIPNSLYTIAHDSRVLPGVFNYKDRITISTQTSISYLKNSKRKKEKHKDCSNRTIAKCSTCTLSTTKCPTPQVQANTLAVVKTKKSVKKVKEYEVM